MPSVDDDSVSHELVEVTVETGPGSGLIRQKVKTRAKVRMDARVKVRTSNRGTPQAATLRVTLMTMQRKIVLMISWLVCPA